MRAGRASGLRASASARRARAASRWARVLLASPTPASPPSVSRLRLRLPMKFLSHGVAAAGPRPPANGQPEEIRTRHQPISMPSRPRRGRTCQCLQPGSPMSQLPTRRQRCARARAASPRSGGGSAPRRGCAPRADTAILLEPHRQLVADPLELAEGEQARAAARRHAPVEAGARVRGAEELRRARPPAARSGRAACGARRPRPREAARASNGGLCAINSCTTLPVRPIVPPDQAISVEHFGHRPERLLDAHVGYSLHLQRS